MSETEEKTQTIDESLISKTNLPTALPVVPLRDIVIFPYMMYPILAGRESTISAINYALEREKYIMIITQKDSKIEDPEPKHLYSCGTVARILQVIKLPNNLIKVLIDGLAQAKVLSFRQNNFLEADIEYNFSKIEETVELKALVRQASRLFQDYISNNRNVAQESLLAYENIKEPDRKLYYIASTILVSLQRKQRILELNSIIEQYYELINILSSELEIFKVEKDIEAKISHSMQKNQRRFIVQEQIKILQEELNEEDETDPEFIKLKEQIQNSKMPKEVMEKAMEEFNKLKKIPAMSPEATVSRNYLDWMVSVPWNTYTKDNLDIAHAKKILDEDHFGLEKPKERVLEHIAILNNLERINKGKKEKADLKARAQILCLVGPPGVGKTSLGKSIARALNRKFVRISLGGVRDEAEIRGHRRTYIGSMPGKIIQSMRRAATCNPIILMDEIDKMGMDFRGDPASALLEALDPEQNNTFNDHYLDVDYDLSKVLFITTANVQYAIPLPLQDRMEIIHMSGYLDHEKLEIAKRHIIPKLLKEHGLSEEEVVIPDGAIKKLINEYTREAGVRNLEREIASLMRKITKELVLKKVKVNGVKQKKSEALKITGELVEKYLGVPKFKEKRADKEDKVGSAVGLAWTSMGGDILDIEVSVMPGKEKLTLTGQLGDVMKESAFAGLSYIRSNAKKFGLTNSFFSNKEVHIHIPEGAIPKDGPSAGITMTIAMLSALTAIPSRSDVAMTGEITLRGEILPIGGLNEKLLAAQRSGIKTVLIPKENQKDLKEIPDKIKEGLKIVTVENLEDALKYIFKKKFKK
ncbi:MAG: endopeptidase La [Chlorobi bacterium]|nr:endopeptidase La [Chlorobiota bacterium]MCI0714817.1 endopeptidase La [Chlorobiota bacterium]